MSTTSNFNTVRVLSKSEFENNFSSTSNDTLYFVEANTIFDGQWVIMTSPTIVDTSTAIGTYDIDLTEQLPKDNYDYELLMFDFVARNDNNGVNTSIYIWNSDIGQSVSNDDVMTTTFFSHIECDGAHFQQANNSFVAKVTSTRTLKKTIFNVNAKHTRTGLLGYRRIGTNQ